MRPLKDFDEFLKSNIIRKRAPDIPRARSLIREAQKRREFLTEIFDKISISDKNANYFIENSYDILIELIRAKFISDGFYASGEGAHEAEVAYMSCMGFPENDVRFMNDLRYFRNGIKYYGKNFDKNYAEKIIEFLNKIYPQLTKKVENLC